MQIAKIKLIHVHKVRFLSRVTRIKSSRASEMFHLLTIFIIVIQFNSRLFFGGKTLRGKIKSDDVILLCCRQSKKKWGTLT